MHSVINILLSISTLAISQAFAQKVIYFKPFLGGQFPLQHYDRAIGKAPGFSATYLNIELAAGLDIQLELSRKWRLSLGGHHGVYGFGYKIKTQTPKYERSGDNSSYITRIPFGVQYTIKDELHLINLDKIEYAYLIVGRLYSLLGISYNQVAPPGNLGQLSAGSGSSITIDDLKRVITNRDNLSVYLGVGMQFYNGGKDRLDVSIYWSRGLGKLVYQDLFYTVNGVSYQTRLWSRGTIVAFNVAYPIRLKTFPTKNQRSIYK